MIRSVLLAHEAEIRDSLGEFVYLTRTGLRTVEAYYTLPPSIRDDSSQLVDWAERAVRTRTPKRPQTPGPPRL